MKLSQTELVVIGLIILYVAFFSNPPPAHIKDFMSSPVGHAVSLLAILYVTVYRSMVVGVFLGIAYVMTASKTTEYLDSNEQKPKEKATPTSAGVPKTDSLSSVLDAMKSLPKGDTVAHKAVAGKSVTTPPPPSTTPKPADSKTGTFSHV
jgi:hypothetical protein